MQEFKFFETQSEGKYGREVSFGEVFMAMHTRADGSFVDQKAKQVSEAYEKNIEEVIAQMDFTNAETSEHSQESTQRTLTIQEEDEIFLKCTITDDKGNPFGLGRETVNKRKRSESSASSSSSLSEMLEQLQAARQKIAEQDIINSQREAEQRIAQSRISSLEMIVSYLKTNDPQFAEFLARQDQPIVPPETAQGPAPATAQGSPPATALPTGLATSSLFTASSSPI